MADLASVMVELCYSCTLPTKEVVLATIMSWVELCRFAALVLENRTAEYQIKGRIEDMVPLYFWIRLLIVSSSRFCGHWL